MRLQRCRLGQIHVQPRTRLLPVTEHGAREVPGLRENITRELVAGAHEAAVMANIRADWKTGLTVLDAENAGWGT